MSPKCPKFFLSRIVNKSACTFSVQTRISETNNILDQNITVQLTLKSNKLKNLIDIYLQKIHRFSEQQITNLHKTLLS